MSGLPIVQVNDHNDETRIRHFAANSHVQPSQLARNLE